MYEKRKPSVIGRLGYWALMPVMWIMNKFFNWGLVYEAATDRSIAMSIIL